MITLLEKQGKEIQEQDKIMERIEEFYSELFDSDQAVTIQTDPKEVPPIMAWEVEAALRKMKNGKEAGKDRRIMTGWAAYAKHRDIFKSNLAICLKRQVYNYCVLPAMTYGAETWTLTKQAQNKLAAAQTKMERSMLNITYKDRRTNIWVRERTKLIDIIYTVRKMKWSWAGHINRLKDDRWTSRVMTRKYVKGDQPSGGETTWTNTGATRYGRGQHKTGSFGDDMLRPSPNHGTQRLLNDE